MKNLLLNLYKYVVKLLGLFTITSEFYDPIKFIVFCFSTWNDLLLQERNLTNLSFKYCSFSIALYGIIMFKLVGILIRGSVRFFIVYFQCELTNFLLIIAFLSQNHNSYLEQIAIV